MRQTLAGLANTRAFNNHFETSAHEIKRAHEEKAVSDAKSAFKQDYVILTGQELTTTKLAEAIEHCYQGLTQIAVLSDICKEKSFLEIDVDACLEAVKAAEGGPKRDRLQACIRERGDLAKRNTDAPDEARCAQLGILAAAREEIVGKTAGNVMFNLFKAGIKALELPEWQDNGQCPLCENQTPHDLKTHITGKLANFTALDDATQAVAVEWNQAGWADLSELEQLLEPANDLRLIAKHKARANVGTMTHDEALRLGKWVSVLRKRAAEKEEQLSMEQKGLEKELPPSTVEVAKKIEAARRLQENCIKIRDSARKVKLEVDREATVSQIKNFLDTVSADFASAEAQISKDRLAAVEPVFQSNFARMSFPG